MTEIQKCAHCNDAVSPNADELFSVGDKLYCGTCVKPGWDALLKAAAQLHTVGGVEMVSSAMTDVLQEVKFASDVGFQSYVRTAKVPVQVNEAGDPASPVPVRRP